MLETNAQLQSIFKVLEEWRSNIKNIIFCLERFRLNKYDNDVKKQSLKFAKRMNDIIAGIKEHDDQFDLERVLVLVRTELKMLEFDRNKVFNIMTEVCSHVTSALQSENHEEPLVAEKREIRNLPADSSAEREHKSKVALEDGSEYTGEWLNSEPDGKGVRTWPHAEPGSGAKLSTYKLKYEGSFQRGRAHGHGKCTFANGTVYEGGWENDEKHGQGKQTNKKGIILTGCWAHGSLEGKGKEVWPNGDVYEGDFSMGKKHGNGVFKFNDGS